jgi:hypothetical protein
VAVSDSGSVAVWQCLTVAVAVWQCLTVAVAVWQCAFSDPTHCATVAVRATMAVTVWQCGSVAVWQCDNSSGRV